MHIERVEKAEMSQEQLFENSHDSNTTKIFREK